MTRVDLHVENRTPPTLRVTQSLSSSALFSDAVKAYRSESPSDTKSRSVTSAFRRSHLMPTMLSFRNRALNRSRREARSSVSPETIQLLITNLFQQRLLTSEFSPGFNVSPLALTGTLLSVAPPSRPRTTMRLIVSGSRPAVVRSPFLEILRCKHRRNYAPIFH